MPHVVQQETTLAYLESQVAAALTLRSSHEYRHWLLLYARYLVNEGEPWPPGPAPARRPKGPQPAQQGGGPAGIQPYCEQKGWGRVHVEVIPGSLRAPRPSEPRRPAAISLLRAPPVQQLHGPQPSSPGPSMSLPQDPCPLTRACPPPLSSRAPAHPSSRSPAHAERLAPGRAVRCAVAQVMCQDEQQLLPDGAEVARARWFSRAELQAAVLSGEVIISHRMSIARALIEDWYGGLIEEPTSRADV